jgi:hypothetical protein
MSTKKTLFQKKEKAKPVKKIRVLIEIEGSMVDKDTALTEQSARDYFELLFQSPKGLNAHVINTEDVTK